MGSREDSGKPHYLDHQLETCLIEFEEDRKSFWTRKNGDDCRPEGIRAHADQIANALLRQTENLLGPGPVSELLRDGLLDYFKQTKYLKELARTKLKEERVPPVWGDAIESIGEQKRPPNDSLLSLVWERFCISLAQDSVGEQLIRRANRMLRLTSLLSKMQHSETTLRYLQRVSRCYILGLDVECVILCRAAVESALINAVPDEKLKQLGKKLNGDEEYSLSLRLHIADKLELLDGPTSAAAHRVKNKANDGIHRDPKLVNGVFSIIQDMVNVIDQLAGSAVPSKIKQR